VVPSIVQIGFGLLVVFLLLAYLITFHRVDFYRKKFRHFLLVWLGVTGVLGSRHFFEDFHSLPPRIPLFLLLFIMALAVLGIRLLKDHGLARVRQFHLVLFQAFRIPVEILLSQLAMASLLPMEMSFHGRNFDILTGLTALPLAWYVHHKGEAASKKLLIAWNILGLILVSIVMIHGLLSAPYPLQVLKLEVDNFIIGFFPVIWLPLFLVPTAYFFHIVSLLKIRSGE
jgi:hypothetical protein